jgi:vacuolar-type H+-ATPase subunit C/Vma6
LDVGDYERLLQSSSYSEFMKLLMNTYYGPAISRESPQKTPAPDELALILSRDFAEVSHSLSRSLTGKVRAFTQAYMDMFLAESLKSIIRGIHVGLEKSEILRFSVPVSSEQADVFSRLVDMGTVSKLVDALPYPDARLSMITRLHFYDELKSTAPLEVALEEWYLGSIMSAVKVMSREDRRRVLSMLEPRVILRNMLVILRAQILQLTPRVVGLSIVRFTARSNRIAGSMVSRPSWREALSLLEDTGFKQFGGRLARLYEEKQSLADLELATEDFLAQRVRLQMTGYPFHAGTIFGFFNLKFYEIRNIRSIAVGIERGESAETIRRMITLS